MPPPADLRLVPSPARPGADQQTSRAERSRLTAELLGRVFATADAAERADLLDRVVVLNCRVADAVASRYRDRGVPLEDLQQAAYEGLVKAVHRFDPAHADDLLTFAVPTIRGEVQRHFRDRSWMVRPPRRVQELQSQTNSVIPAMRDELGREPTDAEVRVRLGIGAAEYAEVVTAFGCFSPSSLDRQVGDDAGSATMGDLLADDGDEHDALEARVLLEPAVRDLGERDQRMLFLRFYEERSQREIADELGLTQAQVSRLLERVLRTLRWAVEPDSRPRSHQGRSA
ncbi:sigma-70 family RNA polymerase sigma factor [Nocardioides plantarum]|uniref:Sigma-70 family RNA polymerase sigma factor n=1 Tax=Nocardioides plantarum TaxID=29299 RepID=A0ABV5KCT1_9ACTN|nr:sigma-70 family RNA polymerase sigma factor [Nocardioides plantarum]